MGGRSAKPVHAGSTPAAVSSLAGARGTCVGLALASHPGCNPGAFRLCRFNSCPAHWASRSRPHDQVMESGRHTGLRSLCPQGREGSSPSLVTVVVGQAFQPDVGGRRVRLESLTYHDAYPWIWSCPPSLRSWAVQVRFL